MTKYNVEPQNLPFLFFTQQLCSPFQIFLYAADVYNFEDASSIFYISNIHAIYGVYGDNVYKFIYYQ